jgi:hypothetical protein
MVYTRRLSPSPPFTSQYRLQRCEIFVVVVEKSTLQCGPHEIPYTVLAAPPISAYGSQSPATHYFVFPAPLPTKMKSVSNGIDMSSLDTLPYDVTYLIITDDPQTWRAMRLVSTYYLQLLSWAAYVDKFTIIIVSDKGKSWRLDGKLHREHDLPAYVGNDGERKWHRRGRLYRANDKPGYISFNGDCSWCEHGRTQRGHDRPSYIFAKGSRTWSLHGHYHRDNDLPAIVYPHGDCYWCQHSQYHRDYDRPAVVINNGSERKWYQHSELHRDHDRPAYVENGGTRKWFIHNQLQRNSGRPVCNTVGGDSWWYKNGVSYRSHNETLETHNERVGGQ